ncbi:nuclear transport factor 2 family protein [Amycolatopsis thermophila]|uniref:Ketosteroid isomerase-like protein n=1 Tax=Amycolatopsis thermophila TaxID=206084 RepID=A0ABU0F585_9PSEU|nr:nuclear transport factor 2 family protein [Amycolatopsis thermophila]MDQ0382692.1 ketosteroid isomerase-like protein [Amycolatopsis thermophila]
MTITVDGKQKVRDLIDAMTSMDMPRYFALWADDGVMEWPFVPAGFPTSYVGKEAIVGGMSNMSDTFESFTARDVEVFATDEEGTYFVEWTGRSVLRGNGGAYDNHYVCVVKVRDDKVTLWREYFDARVVERAFAGVETGFAVES